MNANKNGFFYVIDRTNGKLIAAHPLTRVTWATHVDLKTGRPVLTDVYQRLKAGEEVSFYPQRGTNATLFSYNPRTGLVYFNSWDLPRIQKYVPYQFKQLGEPNTAVAGRNADVETGRRGGLPLGDEPAYRRVQVEGSHHGHSERGERAGHRRRAALHRPADRGVHRARRGYRRRRCGSSRPARASTRRPSPTRTRASST